VYRELLAKTGPEAYKLDEALSGYIKISTEPRFPPEVKAATLKLGPGERQAVALAYEFKALLIIDDKLGRFAARRLGLQVTGVAGFLIRAKEVGLLSEVIPVLEAIRNQGYWLSDELLKLVAKLTGEKWWGASGTSPRSRSS